MLIWTPRKTFIDWRLFYFIGGFEGGLDFLLSILVVVFFYSKRTAIPYVYIGYLLFSILITQECLLWDSTLSESENLGEAMSQLIKLIFQTLIWE